MFPLIGLGAGLAAQGISKLFGKKKAPAPSVDQYGKEFESAIGTEKSRRDQQYGGYQQDVGATRGALDELGDYNPGSYDAGAAVKEYAGGAISDMNQNIKTSLRDLKSQAGGSGRLDTGFYDEDQGDVITEAARGASSDIARQATAAAGISSASQTAAQQTRLGALEGSARGRLGLATEEGGSYGEGADRYLDTVVGGANRQQQIQNANQQSSENKRKGIFGFLGGAIKTALPYILKKPIGG